MNPDDYFAQQASISAVVARYVATIGRYFQQPKLGVLDWMNLLHILFPPVSQHRYQSAALARRFYDAQRAEAHPELPPAVYPHADMNFEDFAAGMDPARIPMSRPSAPDNAVAQLALHAVREVENGGRQQIIHAVEDDPATHIIRGWARIAGDDHPCAWCLMLISRGPVYQGTVTAGLNLGEYRAEKMIAAGEDVAPFMKAWHAGCRCRVVPVFKTEGWAGQSAAAQASRQWASATREAAARIDSGEARSDNLNRETLNALRRRLDHSAAA